MKYQQHRYMWFELKRKTEGKEKANSVCVPAFQVRYLHFLCIFSFSLTIEAHRNKSLCSSKCPHSILDGISNKGTVSCKEYYISLIVLQIPFLIKIKIFIVTTLLYSLQICAFLVCLEDDALDTSFFFFSLRWERSSPGEKNLQQLILFVCGYSHKNSQAKLNSACGAQAWWFMGKQ